MATHQPCPDCGSSDALAIYDDHTYCFSCGMRRGEDMEEREEVIESSPLLENVGRCTPIPSRCLSRETCEFTGITTSKGVDTMCIFPYHDSLGQLVAQKIRISPKGDEKKTFRCLGNAKGLPLWLQHKWNPNEKLSIIVTEGELDAASILEANDCKWPVVSVPNGAQSARKAIEAQINWLTQFGRIILCFDMDEPGKKAALDCAMVLPPGKVSIASLSKKDASDVLCAGGREELQKIGLKAKSFRPDSILDNDQVVEEYMKSPEYEFADYPWPELNAKLGRCALGQLIVLTAGTGIGKSFVARSIAHSIGQLGQHRVGYIGLEENPFEDTLPEFVALHTQTPCERIRLRSVGQRNAEEAREATKNIFFYNHCGALDPKTLLDQVRFFVTGLGCRFIVFDHISVATSDHSENERTAIEAMLTGLMTITKTAHPRPTIVVISHLKRANGKNHEEGSTISLNELRGSHGIPQLASTLLALVRNKVDDEEKNLVHVYCLKNRLRGSLGEGLVGTLTFNTEKWRLEEVPTVPNDDPPFEADSTEGPPV